jgi:hypothetical protein
MSQHSTVKSSFYRPPAVHLHKHTAKVHSAVKIMPVHQRIDLSPLSGQSNDNLFATNQTDRLNEEQESGSFMKDYESTPLPR